GRLSGMARARPREEREADRGDPECPDSRSHAFGTSSSTTRFAVSVARGVTRRYPIPWKGWSASHGIGAFFGTEPGAGSGNIIDFAEWCSILPVVWWFSWWMWP